MIKKMLSIFLFVGIIGCIQAQELNESSIKLKEIEPKEYANIKAFSIDKWGDNKGMVNHSINEQTDAFLRLRSAKEQTTFVWEYFKQALKDYPKPDEYYDFVGIESFYNIILQHNKDVVQPEVSVSLKGFTIGTKLVGEDSKFTTVGGVEGILKAETLNDGTIFRISFVSSNKEKNPIRISETNAINCLVAMNNYYKINFEEIAAGWLPRGNRRFDAEKGSISFMVEFLKDNIKDPVFSFKVYNKSLNFRNMREKKEGINSDF